jgi:hypothetical protein
MSEAIAMRVVVRTYSGMGATALMDTLEAHKTDLEALMRSIRGFKCYTLARSGVGGFSVTVCNDEAGIDEINRKVEEWVAAKAGETGVGAPRLTDGTVILHLT